MPKSLKDLYPGSSYLNASDVKGTATGKILSVGVEKMPRSNTERLVLEIEGQNKKLALNATNVKVLAARHGEVYDAWVGKEIQFAAIPTSFQGQSVNGLRIL